MPRWSTRSALFARDLRQSAKERGKELAGSVEFWFRRRYGLTEHDPRYLEMTVEEMLSDYWAHHYFDNPNAGQEEFENTDFDEDVKAMFGDEDDWEELS